VGSGRFYTADRSGIKTAIPNDPGSWNRYAYVGGDPLNYLDGTGMEKQAPGENDPCTHDPTDPGDGCGNDGDEEGDNGSFLNSYPIAGSLVANNVGASRLARKLTVRLESALDDKCIHWLTMSGLASNAAHLTIWSLTRF
jgi:hypothetical protein